MSGRACLPAVVALALILALGVPLFAAYEAHTVTLDARILDPVVFRQLVDGPTGVPTGTLQEWRFSYRVLNIHDYPITAVNAKGSFISRLNVTLVSSSRGVCLLSTNKAGKTTFTWDVGPLGRREEAHLVLKVSTGVNKKGKQEFVDPGSYVLIDGATLKWVDDLGAGQSTDTPPVAITSY